jgi:ketosteroid isomerase-like protein
MKRSKSLQAALMATPDDIEAQFYEAIQQGDIEKLMAVWADEEDIACAHPGGSRVHGPAAVRSVFETMFSQGGIAVHPVNVRRTPCGGTVAVHHVLQSVAVQTPRGPDSACVLATNIYVKTARGWRLLVHHASAGEVAALDDRAERGTALLH